jgi:EpsD family peptidyl-prolyl cis-trans isomerase
MRVFEQATQNGLGHMAHRATGAAKVVLGLALVAMLAACQGKNKASADTSQIVAQVNDSEISIHQVQAVMEKQPALVNQLGDAAAGRVLDSLIEQELAAQAARKAGLDSNPRVLQALELAKREVLARAYQDQLADKATLPDTASVDKYYDDHPELFAQRRQYTLRETQVKATPDQAKDMAAKVEALSTPEAVNSLVIDSGLPNASQNTMQWAENMPLDLLPKLAYLRVGQSLAVPRPDGLLIFTVLHTEDAPVTRGTAQKMIQVAIMNNKRKELVKQGMDALRQKAKIERKGVFAPGAATAAASGAASTAP